MPVSEYEPSVCEAVRRAPSAIQLHESLFHYCPAGALGGRSRAFNARGLNRGLRPHLNAEPDRPFYALRRRLEIGILWHSRLRVADNLVARAARCRRCGVRLA